MKITHLEPGMEELFNKLDPLAFQQMKGATEYDVEAIEKLLDRPLPNFYYWFLIRMGSNMGSFSYPSIDCSANKILSCYHGDVFSPDNRFLMIGFESNIIMPLHLCYDLDFSIRNDARVVTMEEPDDDYYVQFETFREMIAWGKFLEKRVRRLPQSCAGLFIDKDGDVLSHLSPLMESFGFKSPAEIPMGRYCQLFEKKSVAMATSSTPDKEPKIHGFRIGGNNSGIIRRLLGEISKESKLEVSIDSWDPPISQTNVT